MEKIKAREKVWCFSMDDIYIRIIILVKIIFDIKR